MLLHCTLPLLSLFSTYTYWPVHHTYLFLLLSLVGSYQVGYTRSHPNTEVKMLRACSVPLCSHRWERQVIYLFVFLYQYTHSTNTIHTYIHQSIPSIPDLTPYPIRRWYCHAVVSPSFLLRYLLTFIKKTSLAGVEPAIFRFVVWRVSIAPQALLILYFSSSFTLTHIPTDVTSTLFSLYHW